MTRAPRTVLFAVVVLALSGCRSEMKLVEQAKELHASGALDEALTVLERVRSEAPGTPAEDEARTLAASWLVEAAERETSPHGARVRLEQALVWRATSGAAQARLCRLLAQGGKLDDAERCLGEGLDGKSDVPADLVAETRALLARRRDEASAVERKRLLGSPSVHHWKAVVDRFPTSEEAKLAKDKLERQASLCADLDTFTTLARDEITRQRDVRDTAFSAAQKMEPAAKRHAAFEQIGRDSEPRARELKNASGNLDAHARLPGEDLASKPLRAALWSLADSAATLAERLERHAIESEESFDGAIRRAVTGWGGGLGKTLETAEGLLTDAETACRKDGSAR